VTGWNAVDLCRCEAKMQPASNEMFDKPEIEMVP
jgi:hypothetical protein